MKRRVGVAVVLVAVAVLGAALGRHLIQRTSSGTHGTPGTPTTTGAPIVTGAFPASPPARICGNARILNGPISPPPGSVRVDPGQDLESATGANPAGTTFWLAPGTFTLGTSPFGQVIPKDNDVYVGAPGAILDGRSVNRYAFTQTAANVTIRNLTIKDFVAPRDEGVVNHDSGTSWTIEDNTVADNQGAGVFIGPNDMVRDNCLADNGQYGFSAYKAGGDSNLTLDHNEVTGNNTANWEVKDPGCGCTGGGKFWDVRGAEVTDNWVHNNRGPGLWADTDNVAFDIVGNYIDDNDAEGIIYEISYDASIRDNTLERNALVKGRAFASQDDTFPVAAIYISESGGDSRVDPRYPMLKITGNYLEDNWGGVTLWENADRFCGSPANTSGAYCTLGGAASLASCIAGLVGQPKYFSDCRWKTQNVIVSHNQFRIDKSAIDCIRGCGFQAILSNFGTFPTWSPYHGATVENAITFKQNNHFVDNTYVGSWQFMAHDQGTSLSFHAWQAGPYEQDTGSTISPKTS